MIKKVKTMLITGGCGFIGSHTVKYFSERYPHYQIYVFDKNTYAADIDNLPKDVILKIVDISDYETIKKEMMEIKPDIIMHLAAESHVDNSINTPLLFEETNVRGTLVMLECARQIWDGDYEGKLFYHISTDEVYGSLDFSDDSFKETDKYKPNSPYSASKAASDHFVRAYYHTYKMPVIISNCSNNFGTHQYPEKLIPVVVNKLIKGEQIPIYGNGLNVRDWLHVEDHVRAMECIINGGKIGETYNIGGKNELYNIDIVNRICNIFDEIKGNTTSSCNLITFVEDRKGHDLRYSINPFKIEKELNWRPLSNFNRALYQTVKWYIDNEEWSKKMLSKK